MREDEKNIEINGDIKGVAHISGGTVNQTINIYNSEKTNPSIETEIDKIENLIVSNDLTTATKLIVKLASTSSKQIRREAILHQSNLNAMNEELRKFGESEKLNRQFRQLKNSLFEFLDILGDK